MSEPPLPVQCECDQSEMPDCQVYCIAKACRAPVASDDIIEALIQEVRGRQAIGLRVYGRPLTAHNGRDALRDALEEALDLAAYLMQAIAERDGGEVHHESA